jgi:transcription antitermination factor NusG
MPILKREADYFPDVLFALESPWRAAHIRSRQEKAFARYLRQHEVPFYLPQVEKKIRRAGRTITSYLPLFAGYAFFRGGSIEASRALRSHLVVTLLTPNDQSSFGEELRQIHVLQLGDRRLVPHPYLGMGDSVLITDGTFKGYRGVVMRERGAERLVVSVSFIRQSISIEIDREYIAPASIKQYDHSVSL